MTHEANGLSRRDRERLRRQNDILDAAKTVFAERGYAGATLDEIAARAEFGKGTLYNYFPDGKEQILLAIFDQLYDGLCDLIEESFQPRETGSFENALLLFINDCFEFFSERFNLFMILVKEAERLIFSDNAERGAYFSGQQERVIYTLAVPLQAAMDRGELRRMPSNLLAHMLFVNIKGCQMRHCPRQRSDVIPPTDKSTDDMARFLKDLVMFGVATPKIVEAS